MNHSAILFRDELQATFGPLDLLPIPDGKIHRFYVPGDKKGTLNGWYVLFLGRIDTGCFGSWKIGSSRTWSNRKPTDPQEVQLIAERAERARRQREVEQHQRQRQAAQLAVRLWSQANRADPGHPYLYAKGCQPYGLRQLDDDLLVPILDDGALVNLQRIRPDGEKRFLKGGMVKGCYSSLGSVAAGRPLYLCEGWATGATLHEHSGAAVACAMNAGNLLNVGMKLRCRFPDATLIVAGDDDRRTPGNPGRTNAELTAASLACGLVLPPWPADAPLSLSDFNDLRQWLGVRA